MNLSHDVDVCTIADIGIEISGTDAPPIVAALNSYLSAFAKPVKREAGGKCLKCGKPLGGALGSFQWGIVHGEGSCSNCGWPCRAYHRPKDGNGEIFEGPLQVILQYHPDNVSGKKPPQQGRCDVSETSHRYTSHG